MHSCILDLGFGGFQNFWGFWVFLEIFGSSFVYLMIYDHALHFISISTMFHAFRCVLDYWKLHVGRFGLGFNPWCNLFLASHMFMHLSSIHTLSFLFLDCDCVMFPFSLSLSLSLSLSQIDCAWHLSANPLQLGTLLVLSLFLLIHPLFTFGSVMGRPSKTSLRTFKDVAFIQSIMLFFRTFPTLLYPMSFGLKDENLFMRYPWGALSCLYRSFTPIYTVSIPLYLSLPLHLEVHVS